MKSRWKLGVAMAAIAIVTAGGGLALRAGKTSPVESAKGSAPPPLEFAAADLVAMRTVPLATELVMPGTVQALSQATVRAKLSAEIRVVRVREGEPVQVGEVLAEFDTAALKVQLAERTAALESARAQLIQSQRTREANAQLVKQNFISQNAFDTADAAFQAQAAAVEAAQAQLAQTQLLLTDAVVRAPIGGHVSKRHVQPGEKVSFDAPLIGIIDLSRLEVQTQAPVSDVASIVPGARAVVSIEGLPDRPIDGRVERVNPGTEPGTRSINFYVSMPNEASVLRAGMFAKVRLRVGDQQPVPTLPASAVRSEAGEDFVWVLADGALRRQPVMLGRRDERAQRVEVRSGLAADDQVIATKFDNLRDGLTARVVSGTVGEAQVADREGRLPAATAN